MRVYWNFKIRIESKTTPYTKDILEELHRLLEQSSVISQYEIVEDFRERLKKQ